MAPVFAALAAASCTALLGDGTYHFADSSAPNDVSADGGVDVDGDACVPSNSDTCGSCSPGARRCYGQDVLACSAERSWVANSTCPFVCTGAGVCAGACVVGATQCAGKGVQKCDATGTWQDSRTCPFGCQSGACTGACVPGERQCSGTALQTCDNTGAWQTTKMCPFVCMDPGTCSGVCSPAATQCMNSTLQTCDGTGAWGSGTPCAQPTPDCQAGACTCLAKVQTDTHNCGTCGHDCQGQACQGGLCAMESNQISPWGIAVNAANVYWTNIGTNTGDGTVNMAPVSGGTVTALASGQNDPMSIVLDPTSVYWVNYAKGVAGLGAVQKCALAGCSGAPTSLATAQTGSWGIAVDPTTAYFTAGMSVLKPPSGDAGVGTLGTETQVAYPIVVDSADVFWSDAVGAVFKCPIGGCVGTLTPLASALVQGMSNGIAIDTSNVYWSSQGTTLGVIMKVSKAGGTPTPLAVAQSGPMAVAVDGTNVYWTNSTGGTVMKCAVGGCSGPTTLASGQGGPAGIAVDSTYVYWANETGGTIMKVAK